MIQLTDIENFDFNRIVFSEPQYNNNNGSIMIRIGLSNANNDSINDMIISSPPNMLSFGLQEIKEKDVDNVVAYQLPLCFHNKSKMTLIESKFIEFIDKLTNICFDIAKQELSHYNTTEEDITYIHPIIYKKQSNDNVGPILYIKMLLNRYNNQFISVFIDEKTNQEVDPLVFLNKKSFVTAAIKIESIIIGKKITLRMKIYEAVIREFQHKTSIKKEKVSILRPDVKLTSKKNDKPIDEKYIINTKNRFDTLEQDV